MSIEQFFKEIDQKLESKEISKPQANDLITERIKSITTWERVQVSRHIQRPYTLDYITHGCKDFLELHGDRKFGDDPAIVAGLATLKSGRKVMLIGHQKGRSTKDKVFRNFGMARPEGYRKSLRLMKLAQRWKLPILTLIDTPGAYPGLDAEQRGQAEAIADNILEMSTLTVPTISVIIGEGGSGGALALAVTDRVYMLEYSIYSVISPESCASILWSDVSKAQEAAEQLKLTADNVSKLPGLVHGVIPEPIGGAQRSHEESAAKVFESIEKSFQELELLSVKDLVDQRQKFLRQLGQFAVDN
jgi:acetyl-CoA carboxylase carboxyl transferase subunit alpha